MNRASKRKKVIGATFILLSIVLLLSLGFPLLMLSHGEGGRVTLEKKVSLPFTVHDKTKIVLLYFGIVGCGTLCEPSLEEIADVYETLKHKQAVDVYFINLVKNENGADLYARYFHKDFIGLNLTKQNLEKLMMTFQAYATDPLFKDGEISHTSHLYLIKHLGEQDFMLKQLYYTRPFHQKTLTHDIQKELL